MAVSMTEQVIRKIDDARVLYYRLIALVGPSGSGKTRVLQLVSRKIYAPLINVNLSLSRQMLELTERQRALQAPRLLGELVGEATGDLPAASLAAQAGLVLLDNIEILFDVHLKQDPLRLLQGLSRNKTIVAAWSGSVSGTHLTYAAPTHPEYRRYPIDDLLLVRLEGGIE